MKIFISQDNSKFINNLLLNRIPHLDIISGNCKNNLYKIHQIYNPSSYIFSLSSINNEILQFIREYGLKIKIIIYHPNINKEVLQALPNCLHLIHDNTISNNTKVIPKLINKELYINTNSDYRHDSICSFVDDINQIPEDLASVLYPNTKLKIKLYGGSFKHAQNLGLILEQDKPAILNQNKYYLDLDNKYTYEAVACGCEIYTLDTLRNDKKISIDTTEIDNIQTYSSFLMELFI